MLKVSVLAGLLGVMLDSMGATAAGPVVRTNSGAVSGITQPGLRVFLGIPYARPPIGTLRWRAPQAPIPWHGVRAATHFAASCFQDEPKPFGPYTAEFLITPERSEDCLYLNVWAPTAGHAGKWPVYFFIHGGAFQAGGASVPVYDGADLARKGAVVVTINYRLGVLGFLAHPELTRESTLGSSGNYGVLDVIAALRWVRANISGFGGDPGKVTIAGQSAGAAGVNDLLMSPLAKGLFQRAVIESGPILGIPMPSLAEAERAGSAVAAKLNAGSIAALRAVPPMELAKVALLASPFPNIDGKVIAANPEQLDARVLTKVPVIAGYNRDETAPALVPQTVATLENSVRQRFGALADRFLALYPHGTDAEAARSGAELARDRYIAALLLWAKGRTARGEPVYAYLFEHTFPGNDSAGYGAFHTAEVPYIFGALTLPGVTFTPDDHRVSDEMQQRWLSFMRTGNPNPGGGSTPWPDTGHAPPFVWRIGSVDSGPVIDAERLALFRDFLAQGGKLSIF
jgi:para-nitrobenzyl esterase